MVVIPDGRDDRSVWRWGGADRDRQRDGVDCLLAITAVGLSLIFPQGMFSTALSHSREKYTHRPARFDGKESKGSRVFC